MDYYSILIFIFILLIFVAIKIMHSSKRRCYVYIFFSVVVYILVFCSTSFPSSLSFLHVRWKTSLSKSTIPESCLRVDPLKIGRQNSTKHKPFKILFWTTWYGYYADESGEFVKPECSNEFVVTSNRSECGDADVIAFQYMDIYRKNRVQFPPNRDASVPWVLALQEASIQHPQRKRYDKFDGIFNWTWSFRSDSLIHSSFNDMFEKFKKLDTRWMYGSDFSKEFLSNKTKLAAWVVSNCAIVKSKRNELVENLSKEYGIQIDIYGKCGRYKCEKGEKCFEQLGKSYKFYLALENSLCEDYITEKIYHGLFHGMVPVVYALGNVEIKAPPNSFINVLDFPTLSDLAEKLKYLDRNSQQYFKYFEWRQVYDLNITGSSGYHCHIWRKMKEYTEKFRANQNDHALRHVYDKFSDWYNYFYNSRLNKSCEICLSPGLINITHLEVNKKTMYEDPSRCV